MAGLSLAPCMFAFVTCLGVVVVAAVVVVVAVVALIIVAIAVIAVVIVVSVRIYICIYRQQESRVGELIHTLR